MHRVLLLLALLTPFGFLTTAGASETTIDPGISSPRRVLFIGNSLISWNGSWATEILQPMIDGSHITCTVDSLTQGGQGLDYHWDTGVAKEMIENNGYDIVVLQNHSSGINRTYTDLFDALIRANGGITMIYQTDSDPYTTSLCAAYVDLANDLGAQFNPVAEIVNTVGLQPRHSDYDGRYLKALSFYHRLFGAFPTGGPTIADTDLFAQMQAAIIAEQAPYIDLANKPAQVATPAIGVDEPIFYDGSCTVTLICATAGAAIYYTTDGSLPDPRSAVYSGPFELTQSTDIRVYATHPDLHASLWSEQKVDAAWTAAERLTVAAVTGSDLPDRWANITDGDTGSGWWDQGTEAWVVLDLGQGQAIADVRLLFTVKSGRSYDVDIEVSDDGASWTRANWIRGEDGSGGFCTIGIARQARYLRLRNRSSDFLSIREAQVWGANLTRSISLNLSPAGSSWRVECDGGQLSDGLPATFSELSSETPHTLLFVLASEG